MVQKEPGKRGRPRAYDPDTALARAMAVFWDAGFAGTSLDDLTAGMQMNRPSLYNAFGDKHALYLQTLARYGDAARVAMTQALAPDVPLRAALQRVYDKALAIYLTGPHGSRGCFLIGTAVTEAVMDADTRAALAAALREIDDAFAARFRLAQAEGAFPATADAAALGRLASAVLHTLAIRARMGEPRATLESIVAAGLDLLCGPAPAARPPAPPERRASVRRQNVAK